jgi:hypothetical protein
MSNGDRPWYRDPPKLVPVIVGVIAIFTGAAAIVRSLKPSPPDVTVEYVLDVSHGMIGRIGHKDKLRAVEAEIVEHARDRPNSATALRLAGGQGCSTSYRPPTVPFGEDNGDRIEEAFQHVSAGGRSDFARAMAQAANDLQGHGREVQGKSKTVFLFVGGRDTCSGHRATGLVQQALEDLRGKLNVEVTFKFVGVKPRRGVRHFLRAVSRKARQLDFGADVVIARRPGDLANALPGPPSSGGSEYPP